jgi:hypothetical protein
MGIRDWPAGALVAVCLAWPLVLTALLWGPTLVQAWKARAQGDTLFIVAHLNWWIAFAVMALGPPLALTLIWYRDRGT